MSTNNDSPTPRRRYWPIGQLVLARLREFHREPEAIFWVYGFPILMVVALGIAFRNKPVERIVVDVAGDFAEQFKESLSNDEKFVVRIGDDKTAHTRLRIGKTELVVIASGPITPRKEPATQSVPVVEYVYDPTRPESVLARKAVDDALQRAAGRADHLSPKDSEMTEPGGRYIDFLIPGLLGMSLMGGGLWGLGFVTVDMRLRKLLKRFLATPMKKSHFLAGLMLSRLMFMVPEVLVLLLFSRVFFGVVIQGSVIDVLILILLGAFTFAGLGLLIASRARTIEAVSGLMNLVMLPMWILSGIFFSRERFPDDFQPFIRAIPLTPLNDALRAVMLEGVSLTTQLTEVAILAAWGIITFVVALKIFRWN